MFHFLGESAIQPYIALLAGSLFMVVMYITHGDGFNPSRYKEWFIRCRQKAGLLLKKILKTTKKLLHRSWQFFSGIIFAIAVSVVFIFFGGIYPHSTVVHSVMTVIPVIHPATKTVIDTSKPWVYDFSKLPDGVIDTKIFNLETGSTTANYNNELETYTTSTDNVRVQDGALVLEAKPQAKDGKAYTSGRVDTNGSFSFTYGTLEVTAKLPRGVGTWPAAWLMPATPRYQAVNYPSATDQTRLYTLNGELDFLESVGYIDGVNFPAAHSYDSLAEPLQYTPAFVTNPYDQYHTYGIIKTPDLIEFTLDGNVYASRTKVSDSPLSWPFNQPYYLILNLALGGTWAGKDGIDTSSAPWDYMIKSITYTPPVVR